jgi:hypothetical protein
MWPRPTAAGRRRFGEAAGRAAPVVGVAIIMGKVRSPMAMEDPATIIDEILGEADVLIRRRLQERGIEVLPHLVVVVAPDDQVVLRSNVPSEELASFGKDLQHVVDENTAPMKH